MNSSGDTLFPSRGFLTRSPDKKYLQRMIYHNISVNLQEHGLALEDFQARELEYGFALEGLQARELEYGIALKGLQARELEYGLTLEDLQVR